VDQPEDVAQDRLVVRILLEAHEFEVDRVEVLTGILVMIAGLCSVRRWRQRILNALAPWSTDAEILRGPRNPQVPLMVWTSRKMLRRIVWLFGSCSKRTSSNPKRSGAMVHRRRDPAGIDECTTWTICCGNS
jgi:hypothetical protein